MGNDAAERKRGKIREPQPVIEEADEDEEEDFFGEEENGQTGQPEAKVEAAHPPVVGNVPYTQWAGRGKRKKSSLSIDEWKNVASNFVEIRQGLMEMKAELSESCTAAEVACIGSVIDKIGIAMIRLDVVAYRQLGKDGVGLFNIPRPEVD